MKPGAIRHPLFAPLAVGVLLRLAAAVFGSGYLMHDDHFMVLEVAGSWADGEDYNRWLPWNQLGEKEAIPANFAYAGSQFLVLKALGSAGVHHPGTQALIIRVLHALYGVLIILFGYRLALALRPDRKDLATTAAWILAAGGLWPLLAVHQLVEMVCIPPLLLAFTTLAASDRVTLKQAVLAGVGIGIATGLRYQCGLIGIGLVPVLLMQRQLKPLIATGITALVVFALMQAPDLFIWGEPFVQLRGYISYNAAHAGAYPEGPWYQYLLTLGGLLVPPVSLMLMWGALHTEESSSPRWWRVLAPTLLFLVFHSLFINKQERFILPIFPALIALGGAGWNLWSEQSRWWQRNRKVERMAWSTFWVVSMGLLAVTIPYSGKQTRVQAMDFLYEQRASDFAMIQVDSGAMPPQFYSGSWNSYHIDNRRETRRDPIAVAKSWCSHPPQFLLFQGDRHLGEAVAEYKAAMPDLRYVTTIKPSRIDRWLHEINPINSVERIMVYSTEGALPCP